MLPLTRNDQYAWPLQNTIILYSVCFFSRSLFLHCKNVFKGIKSVMSLSHIFTDNEGFNLVGDFMFFGCFFVVVKFFILFLAA